MLDPGLEGKTLLITGANNPFGIGAATVRAFSAQGVKVFLTYLRESPEIYGVSEEEAKKATTPSKAFGRYQTSQTVETLSSIPHLECHPIDHDGPVRDAFLQRGETVDV